MRKLVVFGLLLVLALAIVALPAGAAPKAARPVQSAPYARIAPAGGIVTKARLNLAPNGAPEATPLTPWTGRAPMPTGVDSTYAAFSASTRSAYVPGGYDAAGVIQDTMQYYAAQSNTWTDDTEIMPFVDGVTVFGWAQAAVCAESNGRIHVVNGVDGAFLYAGHQIYDPSLPVGSRWSTAAYPQLATGETFYSQDSGCAFLGGKMYLFGGYGVVDPDPTAKVLTTTWEWTPATDTWADTGKNMNPGRLWFGYGSNAAGAWAVGGSPDVTTFDPVESVQMFTVAGGWVNKTSKAANAGRLGGSISVFGSTGTATILEFGGATLDATGYVLQADTLVCSSGAACASWGPTPAPGGSQLATPRWFSWGTGAGVSALIGLTGGGSNGTSTVNTVEKLP